MSGKGSTRENILNIIPHFRSVKVFPFFKARKNARALYANNTATRQSASKEMFLVRFFRVQTSNSYFLFDDWRTLPIAANDEEISNFAYHGK